MADTLLNDAQNVSSDFLPRFKASETDLTVAAAATTNSAIKDALSPAKSWKAVVHLDTGAGTATVQVKLQVSSSATFASDVHTLDAKFINANVAAELHTYMLYGITHNVDGKRYGRVQFITGAGTSFVADIDMAAV